MRRHHPLLALASAVSAACLLVGCTGAPAPSAPASAAGTGSTGPAATESAATTAAATPSAAPVTHTLEQVNKALASLVLPGLKRTAPAIPGPASIGLCPVGAVPSSKGGEVSDRAHFGGGSNESNVAVYVFPDAAAAHASADGPMKAIAKCSKPFDAGLVTITPASYGTGTVRYAPMAFYIGRVKSPTGTSYDQLLVAVVDNLVVGILATGKTEKQAEERMEARSLAVIDALRAP